MLPRLPPLRRADVVRFDLTHGVRAIVRVLRRHVGRWGAARALASFAARSLRDPLRHVPPAGWPARQEELTRHQLRQVLHLDAIAREVLVLDDPARLALLADIVAEAGARFVEHSVPIPALDAWRAASPTERDLYAHDVAGRLVNARAEIVGTGRDRVDLDVTACRFVELCGAVGRMDLAPLFCEADSRRFDAGSGPIRLHRAGTIALGASRCDFRFRFGDDDD